MNNNNSYDDSQLFTRIAAGDEAAFRDIVHHYSPKLLSFVFRMTKTMHIAEEIVQEVFLKLWQKREDNRIDNMGGWLHTVAANMTYTHLRREALNNRLINSLKAGHVDIHSEIDLKIDHKESVSLLTKAISQLPEQQRRVYELSKLEGMSREEIGKLLNISPNTVKNHLAKALQSLKTSLKKTKFFFCFIF